MFQYEGALHLTEYYVRNTELRADTSDLVRVEVNVNILRQKLSKFQLSIPVCLQFVIQRRLLSLILTTFLPTIFMIITGHMSNYFEDSYDVIMGMNVTVLLVLTTFFIREIFL